MLSLDFHFCCVILLCLSVIHKSFGEIPTYNCKEDGKTVCDLLNVRQNASQKHFKIIPHRDVSLITTVYFRNSNMEILTEDACDALPYVETFWAENAGLTSIDGNALTKCTKLQNVFLHENSLVSLPLGLFDTNFGLEAVQLQRNKLTEIDGNLFKNNPNLMEIYFHKNMLEKFSFSAELPVMRDLGMINLNDNLLSDIDVEMFIEKCPNLKEMRLDNNIFPCDRQEQIKKALKNVYHWLGKCTTFILVPETTDIDLTTTDSDDFESTSEMPMTTLEDEIVPDFMEIVTKFFNKLSTSTLIIVIAGSFLAIFIFGMIFGCLVKKFWSKSGEKAWKNSPKNNNPI